MWGGLKENQEFHKTATRCDHAHGDKSSKKLREPNGSRDEQRLGRERKREKRTNDSLKERRKKLSLKGEAPQLGAKPSGARVNKHPSPHPSPARTCLHPRRCGFLGCMPHWKWIQSARF
ncbi:hypothetical protein AVEN_106006-1 [Araneus ventricosus]|uniref:Uncharacterized protein n=1 Tax=Araneus ventricosus TaxID=182803 RepID=A0A4Y2NWD6_ARAVE|nr:hypothetical protein AVEN_193737-1 [Araneus ventricosus]GBN43888.1 hypothetical protein AVEN_106006-1 [Araneus ventricosus]